VSEVAESKIEAPPIAEGKVQDANLELLVHGAYVEPTEMEGSKM
jgi:hypothetical protein